MNKLSLLAGVAAVALMAGAAQATEISSQGLSGNAFATGKAFEAAGAVSFGRDSASAGVVGGASSHSTASLTADCGNNCITSSAATLNKAGYAAGGTGDVVIAGGVAGTKGTVATSSSAWDVDLHGGDGALAHSQGGATTGTLVGSLDIGHGNAEVNGFTGSFAGSYNVACAEEYGNTAKASAYGDSGFANYGEATGLLAGAGSYGVDYNTSVATTWATDVDGALYCTSGCLKLKNWGVVYGYGAATGTALSVAGSGALDGDLAFNGTAKTSSDGIAATKVTSQSEVDFDKTYGKIIDLPGSWLNVYGTTGLTGDADADVTALGYASAHGDLVGTGTFEVKSVETLVKLGTVDFGNHYAD